MAPKILVVVGHPSKTSFTAALAEHYRSGAEGAGGSVDVLCLGDLAFDPSLHEGYRSPTPLEPDLVRAQALIREATHLAFFYPQWWGSMPAVMKGFIDRVFLPGFAFNAHAKDPFYDRLLAGRSGEIWLCSDAPRTWFFLNYWNSPIRMFKTATLEFCGIRPVDVTVVDRVRWLDDAARAKWLARAHERGAKVVDELAVRAPGAAPLPSSRDTTSLLRPIDV